MSDPYIIANESHTNFRADLNVVLALLKNVNRGTEPSSTIAGMLWEDSANDALKIRNATNTGWVTILTLSTGAVAAAASCTGNAATATKLAATKTIGGVAFDGSADIVPGTDANTVSTTVKRDASGNFSAGTISAALTGTASNASALNGHADTYFAPASTTPKLSIGVFSTNSDGWIDLDLSLAFPSSVDSFVAFPAFLATGYNAIDYNPVLNVVLNAIQDPAHPGDLNYTVIAAGKVHFTIYSLAQVRQFSYIATGH